jgi:FtsZ-binding cell division protein ZapB
MICEECGASFIPYKSDQRFCCAAHNSKHRQKVYRQRTQVKHEAAVLASTEIDDLREQNGALQKENDELRIQNEQWKESIKKHNERIGRLEEIIDKRDDTITIQKKEIERLKLERRVIDKTNTNKRQHFAREHLERVLTSEIKRQFPNDTLVQTHIVAIRSFNASYINALVTV